MDDNSFLRIFGGGRQRPAYAGRLHFRDANLIADLKARVSGLAARDNRARNSGWLIEASPTRTDALTECSLFDVTLTSATEGERRLPFRLGRDWVEIGGGAMESSVRDDGRNLDQALDNAFRRVVLPRSAGAVAPAPVEPVAA